MSVVRLRRAKSCAVSSASTAAAARHSRSGPALSARCTGAPVDVVDVREVGHAHVCPQLEVEAHGLTLKSALPPVTLVCQWDWILVERAFDNLLRNAIRFSPENGVLRVGATVRERAVELWVEDQGPGVPEDELERIFAPFTQVDPARDHASGGYGIGLALVKRIVELHDGIVVASNQSQGLRVAMTLPIGK